MWRTGGRCARHAVIDTSPTRTRPHGAGAPLVVVGMTMRLLVGGGPSPNAVGQVVFHEDIDLTGRVVLSDTFTYAGTSRAGTSKKVRSCAQAERPATVQADGSGSVTFTNVPGEDDTPHKGWHGGISGSISWTCIS